MGSGVNGATELNFLWVCHAVNQWMHLAIHANVLTVLDHSILWDRFRDVYDISDGSFKLFRQAAAS